MPSGFPFLFGSWYEIDRKETYMNDKLKKANSKKGRSDRIKANLPEMVTGFCPVCMINLYSTKKRPRMAGYKIAICEIKNCPFNS